MSNFALHILLGLLYSVGKHLSSDAKNRQVDDVYLIHRYKASKGSSRGHLEERLKAKPVV